MHLIIVLLILCGLFFLLSMKTYEAYNPNNPINISDIKTNDMILNKIRLMLRDINRVFDEYNIIYWMDGGTLLGAMRHKNVIPWDDDGDISILKEDEGKLLAIEPQLNNLNYGLSKFWGGYKIYPLDGSEIKYYNRNWDWSNSNKDIKANETFDYKYPFVDVFLVDKQNDKYHFSSEKVRRTWPLYYHDINNLFPLKKYKFDCFELYGPNNPIPYLDRAYGNDWKTVAYRQYDHENQKILDKTKFYISNII